MDAQLVDQPYLPPSRCNTCGRHAGPMVDLMIRPDDPAFSPYLCVFCASEIARLIGGLDPLQTEALREEINQLTARILDLERDLELERSHKTISLDEAEKLIADKLHSRMQVESPTFEGPSTRQWQQKIHEAKMQTKERVLDLKHNQKQCSVTKPNGKQCQAFAIRDSDPLICYFHQQEQKRLERKAKREAEQREETKV
jgi:hypothetical protein